MKRAGQLVSWTFVSLGLVGCGGEPSVGSQQWTGACVALSDALTAVDYGNATADNSEWDVTATVLGDAGYSRLARDAQAVSVAIEGKNTNTATRAIKTFVADYKATNLKSCR